MTVSVHFGATHPYLSFAGIQHLLPMKKTFHSLRSLFLVAIVAAGTGVQAQSGHSVHIGPSFPLGDFADDDMDQRDAGGAAIGINVGAKFLFPISDSSFHIFAGLDFNYQPMKDDARDEIEEIFPDDADFKHTKYINIPISAGVNYTGTVNNVKLFGDLGLALNIIKPTNFEASLNDGSFETDFDTESKLGIRIGGGVELNEQFVFSLSYFAIGELELEGDIKYDGTFGTDTDKFDYDQPVNYINLTIGLLL